MRHAPSSDHARLACRPRNLVPLVLAALAAVLSAPACSTAQPNGSGGIGGRTTGAGGSGVGGATGGGGNGNGAGGASSGTGGHVSDGGDAPSGSGGATAGCGSLALCDDFESSTTLNTSLWTIVENSTSSGSATIDTIGAHGSGHSLKVMSNDRLYLRNSTVIGTLGSVAHVRFYARFNTALPMNHGAIMVTHNPAAPDQYSQNNELRFGSQDAVFHWNTDSDAANLPTVGPGDSSSVGVTANTWYCFELTINTNGHLNVSINGSDVAGLTEDGVATPNIDDAWVGSAASLMRYTALGDFNFGWASYGAGPMTIWFDDVALSNAPIGCLN